MHSLSVRQQAIDLVTLKNELHRSGELEDVGGPVYISALMDGVPRSTNVAHYSRIVVEKSQLRSLIDLGTKLRESAYDEMMPSGNLAAAMISQVEPIASADERVPAFETLAHLLCQPDDPQRWRFERLQPSGSRVLLAAQYKSGKTTVVQNMVSALADGSPFLGAFPVTKTAGTTVVIDTEMGPRQLRAWYRTVGIRHADRVVLVPVRGKVGSFNILDATIRRTWAQELRKVNASYLIVDCLRPILDALGLDEHREAGRLLVALDSLVAEAGIEDLMAVHHMGHGGERARGDSRLRDWPDVEWQLVRKTDEAASPRFFKAYGRDVDVPEGQLVWDATTRRLTLAGGSRKDAAVAAVLADIKAALTEAGEPLSGRAIKKQLEETHGHKAVDEALHHGRETGDLAVVPGPRNAKLYRVSQCPRVSPDCPRDSVSECPPAYIAGDTGHSQTTQRVSPRREEADERF
jgi:hypothetical protein